LLHNYLLVIIAHIVSKSRVNVTGNGKKISKRSLCYKNIRSNTNSCWGLLFIACAVSIRLVVAKKISFVQLLSNNYVQIHFKNKSVFKRMIADLQQHIISHSTL